MSHTETIDRLERGFRSTFRELSSWLEAPPELLHFEPAASAWSVVEIAEHVSLTNHFLLKTIRKGVSRALRRAEQEPPPEEPSDLGRIARIGERGSFEWVRPDHMVPTGHVTTREIRESLAEQLEECLALIESMPNGEGRLCEIRMSVDDLGKIDLYQWLEFLLQHARRHLQQLAANRRAWVERGIDTAP